MRSLLLFALIMTAAFPADADNCQEAQRLAQQAFELGDNPATFATQKQLLARALDACPESANAHNLLGAVLEAEQQYAQALAHYQEAARLRPDFAAAWFGVGEMHAKTGQFPLALEAYLHACVDDSEARARIRDLLKDNRYQTAADGAILDAESLLLLFDAERRAALQAMLDGCRARSGDDLGMRGVSVEATTAEFPNILFDTGQATLKSASLRQIDAIAAALQARPQAQVTIHGHTDKQPFAGVASADENLRLNMRLSEDRAAVVAEELARRGIAAARFATRGYGPTRPAIDRDAPEAYARNRRVEMIAR